MKVRNITTGQYHKVVKIDQVSYGPGSTTMYYLDDGSVWFQGEFWACHVQVAEMTPKEPQQ